MNKSHSPIQAPSGGGTLQEAKEWFVCEFISLFEPYVHNTNDHPNCEYVLSEEQLDEIQRELANLFESTFSELIAKGPDSLSNLVPTVFSQDQMKSFKKNKNRG